MYKSPIEVITRDIQLKMENDICKAVQQYGIDVDKDELIRALQYDRNQYEAGYNDAKAEIVHCNDCKHWQDEYKYCRHLDWYPNKNWFCGDGEMEENANV